MTEDDKPKLSRKELKAAKSDVNDIIMQMLGASVKGDLSGLGGILDSMEGLVSRLNLPIDDFADKMANLRATSDAVQARDKDQFAARWAGDMPRMRALLETPYLNTLDLAPAVITEPCDTSNDDDPADDEPVADLPDIYADLVAGKPGALNALIAQGHDLNMRSGPQGLTAIQAALDMPGRSVDVLQRLVTAGADASLPEPGGDDAIYCAVGYGHPTTVTLQSERDVFNFMFRAGSDPNARSNFAGSPLLASIPLGSKTEVEILLDAGARLDFAMPEGSWGDGFAGFTPVMMAAAKPETFKLLLDRGADCTALVVSGINLEQFLADAATDARIRATDDWTVAHASALEQSLVILRDHLSRA